MKSILAFFLIILCARPVPGALKVVATLPDFGAIAREVGGDKVEVTNIARGSEDPHFVDARPSFIRVLNRADVLIEGGAELELGWLPPLVNGARNPRIVGDAPGHVRMSEGIKLLQVPTGPVDRSQGDVHPAGNPHFWLDPANGKIMAAHLAEVFSKLDPANKDHFATNNTRFAHKLAERLVEWQKQMEPCRGVKVVTYHKSYDYLADRFGLEIVGQLEPKPGLEPSPSHLNNLIAQMKQQQVKLILIEPNRPRRKPEYVASASGARLLLLPGMVGADERIKDYLGLFEYDVQLITTALKATK